MDPNFTQCWVTFLASFRAVGLASSEFIIFLTNILLFNHQDYVHAWMPLRIYRHLHMHMHNVHAARIPSSNQSHQALINSGVNNDFSRMTSVDVPPPTSQLTGWMEFLHLLSTDLGSVSFALVHYKTVTTDNPPIPDQSKMEMLWAAGDRCRRRLTYVQHFR